MATITSSLERSLQNCSLSSTANGSDSSENHLPVTSGAAVDLNSQISLPYHWEQCLDLKTGEVYYLNWKTGMREKEDPRTTGDFYSEEDEDDDEEDEYSSYDDDSEQSSSESSPAPYSRDDNQIYQHDHHNNNKSGADTNNIRRENVLVVAGCKSCLMYFMVPKQDPICPKCCGQLLHFDQSENGSV